MRKAIGQALLFAAISVGIANVHGQISINSYDLFCEPGLYYTARYFVVTNFIDIGSLIGRRGGPQAWNFASLPYAYQEARFEYVEAASTPFADYFPNAKLAEHKVIVDTGEESWLFITQQPGTGRIVYGYYQPDPILDPLGVFDPPIIDFRENITFGDSWSCSTRWLTGISVPDIGDITLPEIGLSSQLARAPVRLMQDEWAIPARITYVAQYEVDAYGIITLPDRSFSECIRVNELAQYDIEIDFEFTGEYQPVASYFIRTYYWLAKHRGVVAQITSSWSATPPPDNFSTASAMMVQVTTNHPETSSDPFPVTDLQIMPGKGQVLLSWSVPLNAKRFRVEAASRLGPDADWAELTTTANNFLLVPIDQRVRFFRIVSLP